MLVQCAFDKVVQCKFMIYRVCAHVYNMRMYEITAKCAVSRCVGCYDNYKEGCFVAAVSICDVQVINHLED